MSYPIRPIGPKDVKKTIPEFVIEAVNELISEKYVEHGSFDILQSLIEDRIKSKTSEDFDMAWLDFEPLYRAEGWRVGYDGPGYNETYKAYYRFNQK
jgi:hypothetical protein